MMVRTGSALGDDPRQSADDSADDVEDGARDSEAVIEADPGDPRGDDDAEHVAGGVDDEGDVE